MNEKVAKLEREVAELQRQVQELTLKLTQTGEFERTLSDRVIFNKKVQFMQRVYDKNGGVVTEINT